MPAEIRPIMTGFGAEIRGVDLARVSETTAADVLDWFHRYSLLVFKDQTLTPAQELAVARIFPHDDGPPNYHEFTVDGFSEIQKLGNLEEHGKPAAVLNKIGIEWHTDGTSRARPCVATQLYALPAPRTGGETLFASGYTAYPILPPKTRSRIRDLKVRYNYRNILEKINAASGVVRSTRDRDGQDWPDVIHPLVRQHPVTRREALWVTASEMVTVDEMEPSESAALVADLLAPGLADEFVYSHRYVPGDLVVWHNRCMFHSTTPYTFAGQQRLLHRIAINGNEIPA
jgi:taurine dioxygenase